MQTKRTKFKKSLLLIAVIALLSSANLAGAVEIAVIDSGTDLNHNELSQKRWVNPKDIDDAVDNDDNGYIDDLHGWNFADGNNKLIDKKFLGSFSADTSKFFEIQTRILKGEATQQDLDWMKAARENQALLAELGTFGNFIHGTHVAGIAARDFDAAKLMILKIIPTQGIRRQSLLGQVTSNPALTQEFKKANSGKLLKLALKFLASQQAKSLKPFGEYVGKKKARVANCSFGTSTTAAKMILGPILKLALRRDPTKEELTEYSSFFVGEVLKAARAMVTPAPKTLFVMAAGNDGTNNDELPTSPANLRLDNTITVAATQGYSKLASFSNYGEKMVDVAAPGVGILSSIPGNQHLVVSGTSQAAPFVTNVVAKMLAVNPNLTHAQVKALLMKTSDLKEFLKGKVASGGIINSQRVLAATQLTLTQSLDDAITMARAQIADVAETSTEKGEEALMALPLPSNLY